MKKKPHQHNYYDLNAIKMILLIISLKIFETVIWHDYKNYDAILLNICLL